jgi:fused signal recognition particle receptor
LANLKAGLSRTRQAIGAGLADLFAGSPKLDSALLERIHETLYRADIGVRATDKLVASIRAKFSDQAAPTWAEVQQHLIAEISAIFKANEREPVVPTSPPYVLLIVGVNGVGKTTTIGKLSARFMAEGKSVLLGAADTFRAAAIEQLETWGKRLNVDVIRQQQGSDPAAVAYDALKAAVARGKDILIIDTAGRLHNKTELMDELGKIHRVLGRDVPGAPHETWLVIDATTGQNASTQVKAFKEVANVTGLVVTKLDGTAKGGVLIGIAEQFGIPIRFVGIGEKATDLQPFLPEEFARALF